MSAADHALPKVMDCPPADTSLRIAIVYSRLPFPMMRGDQLTISHLISFLAARGHAVDLYTLDMQGELAPAQAAWLEKCCSKVRIYRHGRWRQIRGLVAGLLRGEPLQVGLFRNAGLAHDLRAASAAGNYDIVYCYYMRSAPDVPVALGRRREGIGGASRHDFSSFLAMQLSQSLNTRRIWQNESNPFKKLLYRIETRLCEKFEARVWQDFTHSVLIGPADVAAVTQVCGACGEPAIDNWVYGAHGTDIARFAPAMAGELVPGRVVFSGSMLYQPNIQAVLWFVENCWPLIRRRVPQAEFVVQGRDPTAAIRALDSVDGIVVTGTVPDVGMCIRSATVCVNPMRAAGGMQNKLIEYMASAKAVVATSIANEGIMAPEDTLRIADDAESFAEAVIEMLDHPREAVALGLRARAHVVEHWTWESHFLKLEQAFERSLAHVPATSAAEPDRSPATGVLAG